MTTPPPGATAVPARVLRTLRDRRLLPPGARLLAAVSGGPDSVALAHLLRQLERPAGFTLVALAHFNHRLRGADADADEAFCRDLAATLGLRFERGEADIAALARTWRTSREAAARRARYAFLDDAATRTGADAIAVGHTLDDQAETFLLRLFRGSGPRGLAGIRPKTGRVVRPLIDIPRADLHAWLRAHGHAFREDPTNRDLAIPRNRIRHEVLPYLRERISPSIAASLARAAALALDDETFLDALAAGLVETGAGTPREPQDTGTPAGSPSQTAGEPARLLAAFRRPLVLSLDAGEVRLDAEALLALPPALGRRVVRNLLERLAPHRFVGFEH
ncbi:MAG TPA: tRNA lysidine(34) synthetase TilS, partial [Vicinamibacterales bacterium]|nr:tRNA lysidine(34) synthetase TilS [Vicinamibacterales bacterium]